MARRSLSVNLKNRNDEVSMPSRIAFRGTVVLRDSLLPDGVVIIEEGRIVDVGRSCDLTMPGGIEVVDAEDGYISPGFVDIHTHGGAGSDYMDGTPEAVRIANRSHARHGTTTIFPTTTTGSPAQLSAMLDAVDDVARQWSVADGARIAGVHWYGPYFAKEKVGAHPKGYERNPDPGIRAGPGAGHHQVRNVCRRTSRGR
jgi:N-acetylglucosamine-6-phosphate deacetylase